MVGPVAIIVLAFAVLYLADALINQKELAMNEADRAAVSLAFTTRCKV